MPASTNVGRFVWYDLMTNDVAAAKAYYTAVFGWGTQDWTPPNGGESYTMWTVKGTPGAGVMTLPEQAKQMGAPPHWEPYVSTADINATVAKAKELGGKLFHGPATIPTIGQYAVLADPQGAVFMAFQPDAAMGAGPDARPFSWHELHTTDHVKALEFYSKLFGWVKTDAMDMGEMGVYQMYGANGESYGGMFNSPNVPRPAWLLYASVDDADATAKLVTERGGKILNGPMDVPNNGGRIVQCMDPQGAMFAVHSAPKKA